MSLSSQQDVCGKFNQIPLRHIGVNFNYLRTQDGTLYQETDNAAIFHSYKMPSGSWVFDSNSGDESYVEMLLRVLQQSTTTHNLWSKLSHLQEFRVEFGMLFV